MCRRMMVFAALCLALTSMALPSSWAAPSEANALSSAQTAITGSSQAAIPGTAAKPSNAPMPLMPSNYKSGTTMSDSLPSYVILVGDEVTEFSSLPDSVFNRIAGRTIFRVNRTELNQSDPFVITLRDSILPYANSQEWMLVGIDLRGAASPEGPYWNNVRLSKGRAKALRDYLSSRLDSVALSETVTTTVAEDYPYLLYLLEQAGDPAAEVVAQAIDRYTMDRPDAIKSALQAADGGRVWRRLLKEYFPTVRAARIVLMFRRIHRAVLEVAEVPEPFLLEMRMPTPAIAPVPYRPRPLYIERPHMLAVSTNLLYDAFYMPQYGWAPMPNINLEFFPKRGKFTFRAQFMWPYYHRWSKHKFFQIRDYHLEVRRYFNPGKMHTGAYLGAYINGNKYGIGLSATKGWQGEGAGAALKVGYVLPLGSGRWRVDFHIAAGGYITRYDPYVWGNPVTGEHDGDYYYDWTGGSSTFHRRNHRFSWFGPTEAGITISYDLLFWRVRKKGASFIRKEVALP